MTTYHVRRRSALAEVLIGLGQLVWGLLRVTAYASLLLGLIVVKAIEWAVAGAAYISDWYGQRRTEDP